MELNNRDVTSEVLRLTTKVIERKTYEHVTKHFHFQSSQQNMNFYQLSYDLEKSKHNT